LFVASSQTTSLAVTTVRRGRILIPDRRKVPTRNGSGPSCTPDTDQPVGRAPAPAPPGGIPPPPAPRTVDVVEFAGTACERSASTTWSPAFSPDCTWLLRAPTAPSATCLRETAPPEETVTTAAVPVPVLVRALFGTVTTSVKVDRTIEAVALEPDASAAAGSATSTVTGNVVVPDTGRMATDSTLPPTGFVAPLAVTRVFWPTFTLGSEASGTSTVTRTAPVPTMVSALEVPAVPPTMKGIVATVPEIGAVNVAEASASLATWRAFCASSTDTLASATRLAVSPALDAPAVPPPPDGVAADFAAVVGVAADVVASVVATEAAGADAVGAPMEAPATGVVEVATAALEPLFCRDAAPPVSIEPNVDCAAERADCAVATAD
jgi:hypothetical protein